MKKIFTQTLPQPLSPKVIIRVLLVVIIGLAYLAGYYHSLWQLQNKKIDNLENNQYNCEIVDNY